VSSVLSLQSTPLHVQQLVDAKRGAQTALAALRVIDPCAVSGDQYQAIMRAHSLLADIAQELARLESRVRAGSAA
jgi:hypothetical protein